MSIICIANEKRCTMQQRPRSKKSRRVLAKAREENEEKFYH